MDGQRRIVERSPECVAAHDKAGWLALFTDDAVVEDPVGGAPARRGARPRRGDDELGRFWDTFIAPNAIRFEVREDIVVEGAVVRDVLIHTRLPNGFEITVPAYLLYELAGASGAVRIRRLAAHWELRVLSRRAMSSGVRGLAGVTRLGGRLVRIQGLRGLGGYVRAFTRGAFRRGKATVHALARAVEAADTPSFLALFVDEGARVALPGGTETPAAFLASLGPGARLAVEEVVTAGFTVAFRFATSGARPLGGAAFAELDPATRRIARLRLFPRG